jgi:hypothetical protein
MKKIFLSAIALPAALSFSSVAVAGGPDTKAEKTDKAKQTADIKKSAVDRAKATDLYTKAANHQGSARTHWEFAHLLWQLRQEQLRKYHQEAAAAASLRRQAYSFAREGARLHQAEVLRGQAFRYHFAHDQLLKAQHNQLLRAEAAAKNAAGGENAIKDLGTAPMFKEVVADITADVAKQKGIETAARNAAKIDGEAAEKDHAYALELEKRAAALEAPVVEVKPLVVAKPPAPAPIKTPASVQQEVAKTVAATVVPAAAPAK